MTQIFSLDGIEEKLNGLIHEVLTSIQNLDPDTLLGVGERKYTNFLYDKHKLILPKLDFSKVTYSDKSIRDRNKPIIRNKEIQSLKYVLQLSYHVPLEGEMSNLDKIPLILYKPSIFHNPLQDAFYEENEIVIKRAISEDANFESTKASLDDIGKILYLNYGPLHQDINRFNFDLKSRIQEKFAEIKNRHLKSRNLVKKLGIPLRRGANSQIKVNAKLREKIIIKEPTVRKNFRLDPFISDGVYADIVTLIHDACKNIERMPSMFRGRNENDLRDFILFVLDPNFILGSATGETFNAEGKTDILIRYSSSNVFVAECKYWHGTSSYLNAIDQLLSYLTWRDSKTALIIFVRNKSISKVIDEVKRATIHHSNYVSFEAELGEGLLRFKFHLNGDDNKEVWLTVMIYHTVQDEEQ